MAGSLASARSGGGWRQLLWFGVAAVGLGFAGYVYIVPYRQLTGVLQTQSRALSEERSGGQEAAAERDRLKTSVDTFEATEKARGLAAAKGKQQMDAMAAQLKPVLQELGASVTTADGRLHVGLAPDKSIDKNGIDVSGEGNAVLKILAGALRKTGGGSVRIKAKFGTGPAPKQLRSLFGTVGEVSAVRAARVMSVLEGAGIAPDHLSIVGEAETATETAKAGAVAGARMGGSRRKRAMAAAEAAASAAETSAATGDRLDIEVEPG